jgi:hypothetical protein
LILKFAASEKLELELINLGLEVGWDVDTFESGGTPLSGQIAWLEAWDEVGNLVIARGNLAFDENEELEKHADLLLAEVLGLQFVGDVLPMDQLWLKMSLLLRSDAGEGKLSLNVGGILKGILELELVLEGKGQMQGVRLGWNHLVWDLSSQVLLDFVGAAGFGEVGEVRSHVVEVVVALGLNFRWGDGLWELASKAVA